MLRFRDRHPYEAINDAAYCDRNKKSRDSETRRSEISTRSRIWPPGFVNPIALASRVAFTSSPRSCWTPISIIERDATRDPRFNCSPLVGELLAHLAFCGRTRCQLSDDTQSDAEKWRAIARVLPFDARLELGQLLKLFHLRNTLDARPLQRSIPQQGLP